jgi:hypothetical protein
MSYSHQLNVPSAIFCVPFCFNLPLFSERAWEEVLDIAQRSRMLELEFMAFLHRQQLLRHEQEIRIAMAAKYQQRSVCLLYFTYTYRDPRLLGMLLLNNPLHVYSIAFFYRFICRRGFFVSPHFFGKKQRAF